MESTALLQIENLEKKYLRKVALSDFSLSLETGRILGLLGPNGSGKTSLLKILAGLQKANKGSVLIDNTPLGVKTKGMVSFLPDRNVLYRWMKAEDAIAFYADYFQDFDTVKAYEMLEFMHLNRTEKNFKYVKGYG